jgi:hypothetical protein
MPVHGSTLDIFNYPHRDFCEKMSLFTAAVCCARLGSMSAAIEPFADCHFQDDRGRHLCLQGSELETFDQPRVEMDKRFPAFALCGFPTRFSLLMPLPAIRITLPPV